MLTRASEILDNKLMYFKKKLCMQYLKILDRGFCENIFYFHFLKFVLIFLANNELSYS
jgi:hypothetical protein